MNLKKNNMSQKLSQYQTDAVDAFSGRMILHADGGTGKTATALSIAERYASGSILFLCPSVIKAQVAAEVARFTNLPAVVITGTAEQRSDIWLKTRARTKQIFIANYELLVRDAHLIKTLPFDMIIVDECQMMKNPAAKSVKLLKKLTPRLRLAMSGTPAPNEIHELYSMAEWMTPGDAQLGRTFWEFKMKHCIPNPYIPGKIDGYRNEPELRALLGAHIYRIKADDVLTDDLALPPMTEAVVTVPLSDDERKNYETLKKEMVLAIQGQKDLTVTSAITLLMRLRQMVSAPHILGLSPVFSAKHLTLIKLIEEYRRDKSNKIIVFSELTSVLDHLNAVSFTATEALMITGRTSAKDRTKILEEFKKPDGPPILLMSSAGQYGLNITEANIIIHFDLTWNAARHSQRVWRAHRRGQTRPVQSVILLAENTVDQKMYSVMKKKERLTKEILLGTL